MAASSQLSYPYGICSDISGNIFIANVFNNTIREIDVATGNINTIAGNPSMGGSSGDGGFAVDALLRTPAGVCTDHQGNLYIADLGNNKIRKITASTGKITTIAGTTSAGFAGDGAMATDAKLNSPGGVAVDDSGNVYIADEKNNRIRKVSVLSGIINTIAGTGTGGFSGDGSPAITAQLDTPTSVAVDHQGNV